MPTWTNVTIAALVAATVVVTPVMAPAQAPGREAPAAEASRPYPRTPPRLAGPGEGVWAWPLAPQPEVVAHFAAPVSRYGPGHRGLDLAGSVGQHVRAVDAGVVTHRGRIAGRGTITVTHEDGVRSTYEPVDSTLSRGDDVGRSQVLGSLSDEPGHCAPETCLHLGAIHGEDYLDPLPFFGSRRVILLPVDP